MISTQKAKRLGGVAERSEVEGGWSTNNLEFDHAVIGANLPDIGWRARAPRTYTVTGSITPLPGCAGTPPVSRGEILLRILMEPSEAG